MPKPRKGRPDFFAVNNFDRTQHYKNRRPPWIKLYNSLLDDPQFTGLSLKCRFVYCALLLLASRLENRIPNDLQYLRNALQTKEEIDLTPLFKAGFLLAQSRKPALAQSRERGLLRERVERDERRKERDRGEEEESEKRERSVRIPHPIPHPGKGSSKDEWNQNLAAMGATLTK